MILSTNHIRLQSASRIIVTSYLVSLHRYGAFPKGVSISSQFIDRVMDDIEQGFCGVCRRGGATCHFDDAGECAAHEVMAR